MGWSVKEEGSVGEELKKAFQVGEITLDDIQVIKIWTRQVEEFGPDSLSKTLSLREATQLNEEISRRDSSDVNFWNDHDLTGEWAGHRSSSFSRLGRIIYKIEDGQIKIVKVVKITATHQY